MISRVREVPACFIRNLPQERVLLKKKEQAHDKSHARGACVLHKESPARRVLFMKNIISRELCVENKKALWYTLFVFVNNRICIRE